MLTLYPTGEKHLDVYAQVFTAGMDTRGDAKVINYLDSLRSNFIAYFTSLWVPSNQNHVKHESVKPDRISGDWLRYKTFAKNTSWNRSFFTTKKGYVGLESNAMQARDIVCILFSGDIPFILRPERDHYHLVGDAYV